MPSITREEVAHLAKLSRLDLSDAELDQIERQLAAILPGSFCAREQHAAAYSTESHVGMIGS